MRKIRYTLKSMIFLITAAVILIIFVGCDDSLNPPSVSSINDVEIFIPSEGDSLFVAEFTCSRLKSSDEDYRIQLSQTADFNNVELEAEWGGHEGIPCSGLYDGEWFVRCSAKINDGDWGEWSPAVFFTAVSSVNAAEVTLEMVNDNELCVDWSDVEGAEYYTISWGPGPDDESIFNKHELSQSIDYFWLTDKAANWGHYYFRIGADEYGIISEPLHVTNVWNSLYPLNGAMEIDTTPLLQWDDIDGASGYQLEFADSEAGLNGSGVKSVSASEYQVSAGEAFTVGETIYWRIRSQTSFGTWEPWCYTLSFDVIDSANLALGDIFRGGYIFNLPGDGTGLCAGLYNVEHFFQNEWGNKHYRSNFNYGDSNIDINGTGAAPELDDDGAANTAAIIAELGDYNIYGGSYAAKVCADLETACYDDWFLPAVNQLIELSSAIGSNGSFLGSYYWSSTEVDESDARNVYVSSSTAADRGKGTELNVRAVRSFTY